MVLLRLDDVPANELVVGAVCFDTDFRDRRQHARKSRRDSEAPRSEQREFAPLKTGLHSRLDGLCEVIALANLSGHLDRLQDLQQVLGKKSYFATRRRCGCFFGSEIKPPQIFSEMSSLTLLEIPTRHCQSIY